MSELNPTPLKSPARRRALLKGVGKGAAMAAAAGAPLAALAVNAPPKPVVTLKESQFGPVLCSLSGWQSVKSAQMSRSLVAADSPRCEGFSPGWWKQPLSNGRWAGGMAFYITRPYTEALGGTPAFTKVQGNATRPFTMYELMSEAPANSVEVHWLCAWLNAKSNEVSYPFSQTDNFPFTSLRIAEAYLVRDPAMYEFLTTFMETHT